MYVDYITNVWYKTCMYVCMQITLLMFGIKHVCMYVCMYVDYITNVWYKTCMYVCMYVDYITNVWYKT